MSRLPTKMIRAAKTLICLALVAWAFGSCWYIHQARKAGGELADTLARAWPEGSSPRAGTRNVLLAAAEQMRQGRFPTVASDLGPTAPLGEEQKAAAQRFFSLEDETLRRFVFVSAAAERLERDGADVSLIRGSLAAALSAAARKDIKAVTVQLDLAKAILNEIDLQGGVAVGSNDFETVLAMIDNVAPAYQLSEDLLTEGHAAAERLLSRAARHYQSGEYRQAALFVGLAARLLGVEPCASEEATPKWFTTLADLPPCTVTKAQAQTVVEYCEAVAMTESPAPPVAELVKRARREFEAHRFAEARWWASVALNALGMTDDTLADDTAPADTPQEETTE